MPYIAGYLLKLSVSLSVVYLFYILVLRRLTFYNWNRWYLLGYSLLAFFIPFVNISPVLEQGEWDKNLVVQLIPMFSELEMTVREDLPHARLTWWSFLLLGAMTGILLMMIRFLVRFISYQRIRRSAQLMVDAGVKVYHVDKSIIPFSFGNAIFINPQLHSEEDLKQIIHHEFIHVKQKHTIDILWGELLCMLNWYNPFAWLIRKAIRQNLEFIADNKVLENGIDKKHYQYLLLKVTGAAHFGITQQFNFSSLKKRIIMMNRSRSARIQLTRFLFLLPLVTVLLLAFRSNVMEQQQIDIASTKADFRAYVAEKLAVVMADTIPAKAKARSWEETITLTNPSVKKVAVKKTGSTINEVVISRRDGAIETYDWSDVQARALFSKRYEGNPGKKERLTLDKPAFDFDHLTINGTVIRDTAAFDASLDGPGNPYLLRTPRLDNVLIVVDGLPLEGTAKLNDIEPNSIETITVLKDETGEAIYGPKARNGVILIETKKSRSRLDTVVFDGKPTIILGKPQPPAGLYIINGIEFSPAEVEKMNIDPERIESIEVLKNDPAVKLYGEKGRNGVIIIKLKPEVTYQPDKPLNDDATLELLKARHEVVCIVDGNTYALTARGSMAMTEGVVNTVIVDNKFYTIGEANKLFKRSEFSGVATLDAKTVLRVHGKNTPAMVLGRAGFDWSKYETPGHTSVNHP